MKPRITDLEERVTALPRVDQRRFRRLFRVSATTGRLDPPGTMRPWIERHFSSVDAVTSQRIVKVTNLVTMESALFNELRARRPIQARSTKDLMTKIAETEGDPFCRPLEATPADVFGRVHGKHCVTASNVAKYDGFHGVVIFDEHNPLHVTQGRVVDYLDTAQAWAQEAHRTDSQAKYFVLAWNCLWKSGASIVHGHAQLTLGRDMHYGRVELLRRVALRYREEHGADYFEDVYRVHHDLGLGFETGGVRVLAHVTPTKERETLLIAASLSDEVKRAVYRALRCFIEELGVTSFNLAMHMPPIATVEEDWSGFPIIVRLVDRGDPMSRTTDVGAMELYASTVVAQDPFVVAQALHKTFDA